MNIKLITKGTKKIASSSAKQMGSTINYAEGFMGLVNAWRDYQVTSEIESTKRSNIAADREVRLSAIREQAQAVRMLIEGTFKERADNFDKFFALLEDGFASGDDKKITAALTMIVEQTKVGPMAQALQLMSSINDPNVDRIEI